MLQKQQQKQQKIEMTASQFPEQISDSREKKIHQVK